VANEHAMNICGIRRRSDGAWWECNAEHGAGWSKRIRQAWTLRLAREQMTLLFERGWATLEDIDIVELAPRSEQKESTDA